jgi:hypothetical protein
MTGGPGAAFILFREDSHRYHRRDPFVGFLNSFAPLLHGFAGADEDGDDAAPG